MAALRDDSQQDRFEELFKTPNVDAMLAMTPDEFEQFVKHVFEHAGYFVEVVARKKFPYGPGVDLNLHSNSNMKKPVARVEVRRYGPQNPLTYDDVATFVGTLTLAGNIPGYLVTTSSFNKNARKAAELPNSNCDLIDGETLRRYITYVGGSRVHGQYAGQQIASAAPLAPEQLFAADKLTKRIQASAPRARVLMVGNNKGGVAKTTTALNIAFTLAEDHNQHVLLVDMDGQASLTATLPSATQATQPEPYDIGHYFKGEATLPEIIHPTIFDRIHLVPSSMEVHHLLTNGFARPEAELQFVNDIHQVATQTKLDEHGVLHSRYDWIILDTPPAQTFAARAALAAADHILIPAYAEEFAELGLKGFFATTKTMRALMENVEGWQHRIVGVLVARWGSDATSRESLKILETKVPAQQVRLFRTLIPQDYRINRAHHATVAGGWRNLFNIGNGTGPAAHAYRECVKEMLQYVNGTR